MIQSKPGPLTPYLIGLYNCECLVLIVLIFVLVFYSLSCMIVCRMVWIDTSLQISSAVTYDKGFMISDNILMSELFFDD